MILGKLQINVYNSTVGSPAENVKIYLLNSDGKTIKEAETDSSGKTPVFDVPAPAKENSLSGDTADNPVQPYSEYRVLAMTDGKLRCVVSGVQVYPSVISFQNIHLDADESVTIRTVVPKPVLWGEYGDKIQEDMTKPLSPSKQLAAYPNVSIPRYITVHEGRPDYIDGPDYQVEFKDYIKKVVSCSIYSTWPTAAITANVISVLSFTLNRTYTDWYRKQGHNFDITTSSEYDQMFSPNQTVFASISTIVDSLFSTFITTEGSRQPILTQCCIGESAPCPGRMSRWGSKRLSERGYSSLEILKHYYGDNIYLMQAKWLEGVQSQFPGKNLQTGTIGDEVSLIQEYLNTISQYYPDISNQAEDGIFGAAMLSAVKAFQKIFNIPITGIIDFCTWYKIRDIYTNVVECMQDKLNQ